MFKASRKLANRIIVQKIYMVLCLDDMIKATRVDGRTFDELKAITCATELSLCDLLATMIAFDLIKEAVNIHDELCYKAKNVPIEILNADNPYIFKRYCTMHLYKLNFD